MKRFCQRSVTPAVILTACAHGECAEMDSAPIDILTTVELISSITKILSGSDEYKGYRVTQHDKSVFSKLQLYDMDVRDGTLRDNWNLLESYSGTI